MIKKISIIILALFSYQCFVSNYLCTDAFAEDDENVNSVDAENLVLPAGTPLKLVMQEKLSSQRNKQGDEIIFLLAEDIVLMGRTYLVAGTPVIGVVEKSTPARSWGRKGSIDIKIHSSVPLYSMPIPLTGEAGERGGSRTVASIGTTVLLGISVIGLLAGGSISGSTAEIEAGTEVTVFSAEDTEIMNITEEEMRELTDEWLIKRVKESFLNYTWDNKGTIRDAIEMSGYSIDETSISVEPIQNYYYQIDVALSDTEHAIFTVRPFEEPHLGKFITLEAQNELAEKIHNKVYKT